MTRRTVSEPLATISFQAEAHDTAAGMFDRLKGLTVAVVPIEGDAFDAELLGTGVNQETGQYYIRVAHWDEELAAGDRSRIVELDIYDVLDRIEVL